MQFDVRKFFMVLGLCCALGLSACLQEDKDPEQVTDAGKQDSSAYAVALGNVALKVQNAVVGDPSWFSTLTGGSTLNLAAMGINASSMGETVKSAICPTGAGTEVKQFTWIDGRNTAGVFTTRTNGVSANTIIAPLRARIGDGQVGTFNGSAIKLANTNLESIPGSCGSLGIPTGAPVIAFTIDRPAAPTSDMSRVEYKSENCGYMAGRQQRGTLVKKRVVKYSPNGQISEGPWETENMGQCVDDVVVQLTSREAKSNQTSSDLSNFANVALKTMLEQQLMMDCTNVEVKSDRISNDKSARNEQKKTIDTCNTRIAPTGTNAVTDSQYATAADSRILLCAGSTDVVLSRFINLLGPGVSTTTWTEGTARLARDVNANIVVSSDVRSDAKRDEWLGKEVSCKGGERFHVACQNIPGAPPLEGRHAGNRWNHEDLLGSDWLDRSWLEGFFGCWIGSCTRLESGALRSLNPSYFTGTDQLANSGVTTDRKMKAIDWLDPRTFKPNAQPTTPWTITNNQCLYQRRIMVADCPLQYLASKQGDFDTPFDPAAGPPIAFDPGIPGNGTTESNVYLQSQQDGRLTSLVTLNWVKCNIKGCKTRWQTRYGPGDNVYIKQWNNNLVNAGDVALTPGAFDVRNEMCPMLQPKIVAAKKERDARKLRDDAVAIANQKKAEYEHANNWMITSQNTFNASIAARDYYYQATISAQQAVSSAYQNYQNYAAALAAQAPPPAPQNYNQGHVNAAWSQYVNAWNYSSQVQGQYSASITAADQAYVQMVNATNERNYRYNEWVPKQQDADHKTALWEATMPDATAGIGRVLDDDEYTQLIIVDQGMCNMSSTVLNAEQQAVVRSTCTNYYQSPGTYAIVPGVGAFCDATFEHRDGQLVFQGADPIQLGNKIITTLLNTEGVLLRYRPELVTNDILETRQHGFMEPLVCGRHEINSFAWPVLQYYIHCGGKGGCRLKSYWTTTAITDTKVRHWVGHDYESGQWSREKHILTSMCGSFQSVSQIPNPIVMNWDGTSNCSPPPPPVIVPMPGVTQSKRCEGVTDANAESASGCSSYPNCSRPGYQWEIDANPSLPLCNSNNSSWSQGNEGNNGYGDGYSQNAN